MIKNGIICGLLTKVMFAISPYTFGKTDAIVTGIAFFAITFLMFCELEETIYQHMSYKARRKFRRLIGMTTIR